MESKITDNEYSKAQEEAKNNIDNISRLILDVINFIFSDIGARTACRILEDRKEGKEKNKCEYEQAFMSLFELKTENFFNELQKAHKEHIKRIKNTTIFKDALKDI